jgi:septal ring factor EnvC (AmiA/AmiB activator)
MVIWMFENKAFWLRLADMKRRICLALMMLPLATWAGTAEDVAELQGKVAEAEAKLRQVQERIGAARVRHGAADVDLRESVRRMVRIGQYPAGFWLMRSVVMDTPGQAELMQVMARQQGEKLIQAQAEAGQLTKLYGQVNSQLQAVRDVQAAYSEADGRLREAEKAVLRRAGIQADALSEDLTAALETRATVVANFPPKVRVTADAGPAGGLPVAGRVERGFGEGNDAKKGGVVLRAAAGADVRAVQAARVLYAGPFRHFGGLVIVKTVRGEDMLMGGLGTLVVKAGEDVAAGQVLGGVGDEGRIYWEVRRSGRVVNPL